MPINQSWVRYPAAASKTFSVSSGRCLDRGELGPAQISLLALLRGYIIGIPSTFPKIEKGSPSCPCVHFTVRFLLYCKLIDERILQNCVVVRAAAALGPGCHRQRFSPRGPVSCQPRPRLCRHTLPVAALCRLQPLLAGPEILEAALG